MPLASCRMVGPTANAERLHIGIFSVEFGSWRVAWVRALDKVVDFVNVVLRGTKLGPSRDRPLAIPNATFDEDVFLDGLAKLDLVRPADVIGLQSALSAMCLPYGGERHRVANVAMQAHPEAAWVLMFDGDGYIRESALRRLSVAPQSAGRFTGMALRLNDWVPQVRAEASAAASRLWPTTPPNIVAEAAPYLFRHRFDWERWGPEALCVDEVLARPDVAEAVTSMLHRQRSGALGRTLSQALRFEAYDAGLGQLALSALLPDVRAVAIKSLLNQRASWPVGHDWEWIDKSMNRRRRIVRTESRQISTRQGGAQMLEAALADKSALVRKVAADVLVERMGELSNIAELASLLVNDPSAAVRDRAAFIFRKIGQSPQGALTEG